MEVKICNGYSYINDYVPDVVYDEIEESLSYMVMNHEFSEKFNNIDEKTGKRQWDGYKRLIWRRKKDGKDSISFLTGLASNVIFFLKKYGIPITINDQRIKPKRSLDLQFAENVQLRPYQSIAVSRCIQRQRGILQAATGAGKCISYKDICITSQGMMRMDEIYGSAIGSQEYVENEITVATPLTNSGVDKATHFYHDGVSDSYNIKTSRGYQLTATPKHRIKVLDKIGVRWKYLSEVSEGDYAVMSVGDNMFGEDDSISEDEAYWYGLLVGDGSYTTDNYVGFSNKDECILSFVRNYFSKNNIKNYHEYDDKRSEGLINIMISSQSYRKSLLKNGFIKSNSLGKTIPLSVRKSSKKKFALFIRGLYDSDGWMDNSVENRPCIGIGLYSSELVDQLQVALLNFGIVSSRRIKKTTHADSHILTIYRDHLKRFMDEIGFSKGLHKYDKLKSALESLGQYSSNTNVDIIPLQGDKIYKLNSILKKIYNGKGKTSYINSSGVKHSTVKSWSGDGSWRNPSRKNLSKFLNWAHEELSNKIDCDKDKARELAIDGICLIVDLRMIVTDKFFYDPIKTKEAVSSDNYDFVIPETHSFSAQGFINHNTIMAAGIMKEIGSKNQLFLAMASDLIIQTKDELEKFLTVDGKSIEVGIVGAGHCDIKDINVVTVQSACAALGVKFEAVDDDGGKETSASKAKILANKAAIVEMLARAEVIIFDEVQHASCDTVSKVMAKCKHSFYRFGLSASPWRDDGADMDIDAHFGRRYIEPDNVKKIKARRKKDPSYIESEKGYIVSISASYLILQGYLVKPIIYMIKMDGDRAPYLSYPKVYKRYIVGDPDRNAIITKLSEALSRDPKNSLLVLVKQILHGKSLEDEIEGSMFLSGSMSNKKRKAGLDALRSNELRTAIATSIFDEGLDVKRLNCLILGGSGKSSTRALQRIGRVIRTFDYDDGTKKDKAYIFDFIDSARYISEHSRSRMKIYKEESEFEVKIVDIEYILNNICST